MKPRPIRCIVLRDEAKPAAGRAKPRKRGSLESMDADRNLER